MHFTELKVRNVIKHLMCNVHDIWPWWSTGPFNVSRNLSALSTSKMVLIGQSYSPQKHIGPQIILRENSEKKTYITIITAINKQKLHTSQNHHATINAGSKAQNTQKYIYFIIF